MSWTLSFSGHQADPADVQAKIAFLGDEFHRKLQEELGFAYTSGTMTGDSVGHLDYKVERREVESTPPTIRGVPVFPEEPAPENKLDADMAAAHATDQAKLDAQHDKSSEKLAAAYDQPFEAGIA